MFNGTGKAVIYDGFFTGSTSVKVRVQGITIGQTVYVYDEDSLIELGSQVSTSEDIIVTVPPISSRRIIAFVVEPGMGTSSGVDVLLSSVEYSGWLTPVPVDEESVPVEIGLYNPGTQSPITARFDPFLLNNVPAAYRAAAILLISEPIVYDVITVYRVDQPTGDKIATVTVSGVKNARGGFTVVIDSTAGNSKVFNVDKTFNIVVTDSEGRVSTKSVTVNPVTGFMPVAPAPAATAITMFMMNSFYGQGQYVIRTDARCNSPLEVSHDAGATYVDMQNNGTTSYGHNKLGVPPVPTTIVIRVKSNPADTVTRTIPVPYD